MTTGEIKPIPYLLPMFVLYLFREIYYIWDLKIEIWIGIFSVSKIFTYSTPILTYCSNKVLEQDSRSCAVCCSSCSKQAQRAITALNSSTEMNLILFLFISEFLSTGTSKRYLNCATIFYLINSIMQLIVRKSLYLCFIESFTPHPSSASVTQICPSCSCIRDWAVVVIRVGKTSYSEWKMNRLNYWKPAYSGWTKLWKLMIYVNM